MTFFLVFRKTTLSITSWLIFLYYPHPSFSVIGVVLFKKRIGGLNNHSGREHELPLPKAQSQSRLCALGPQV